MMTPKRRPRTFIPALMLFVSTLLGLAAQAAENFPQPAELDRDVAFWLRVYTEVDTHSGYIHDAYNLSVVYQTLTLTGQRRADEKLIRAAKSRYADIVNALATDPGSDNEEHQRVLALFPADISAAQLRAAADNIRFQRGQSDRFRRGLARSTQWTGYIEQVLAERNLPLELAALPHVESSFNPNAYSSVGAAGIWQFTRSTGRRYMHIDYVVDERMDPFAATVAAAQLLEHNRQLTGSWPLALTAYNHGAAGVRRATRQLGSSDIDQVVRKYKGRAFGFASRNFYVSFLAAAKVSADPQRYFAPYSSVAPVKYERITLPEYMPVDAFARAFNIDLDTLKQHNRALLEPVWIGKKHIPRGYTLLLPSTGVKGSAASLLAAIPADQRFDEQTPDLFHKVVPGDTVSEIASRYGHSIREVAAMNGLNRRYQIRIGQVLRLPLEGAIATAAVNTTDPPEALQASVGELPKESVAAITVALTESGEEPPDSPPASMITAEMAADPGDYTVAADNSIEIQAVETLGHYAEWLDLRASQLRALNGMPYGRALVIGHRLKLDFSRVEPDEFERRRLAYQYDLQQSFFMTWQIHSTRKHIIAPGESLWVLTQRQFKIPMWLLRQYNPDLDLDKLHPGTVIVIPELVDA
jgi:peptidoglycan lytic transglycosylase D